MNKFKDNETDWMLLSNNGKLFIDVDNIHFRFYHPEGSSGLLIDISDSLSLTFRCGGRMDWTVDQHSVLVSRLMQMLYPETGARGALDALLHDAHEAYTSDIPHPIGKLLPKLGWVKSEIQRAIYRYLELEGDPYQFYKQIKKCDELAWKLEAFFILEYETEDSLLAVPGPVRDMFVAPPDLESEGWTKAESMIQEISDDFPTIETEYLKLISGER